MNFTLIDKIVELHPGSRITAVKSPTMSEEYLQDHFPQFPVMPGVLMLESMVQAASWLLLVTDNFLYSQVSLKEARNVRYSGLVRPGETLRVAVEIRKREDRQAKLDATGFIGDQKVVSAKLILEQHNLADDDPSQSTLDGIVVGKLKKNLSMLYSVTPN